eukprot:4795016-Amphidinium_carterae.1
MSLKRTDIEGSHPNNLSIPEHYEKAKTMRRFSPALTHCGGSVWAQSWMLLIVSPAFSILDLACCITS